MSARGFIILLVVTVLAVVGAIFAAVQPTLSGAESVAGDAMFPALSQRIGEAGKVTVQTPQYTVSWDAKDGAWVSPEHGGYPSRQNAVPDLVRSLAGMTKVEAKTAQPDWYQYIRVGDPAATPPTGVAHVTVTSADGQVLADAILGARSYSIPASHTRGGMFVREPAGTQSWLVEGIASVPTGFPEWLDTILDVPGSDVVSIAIIVGDKTIFEVKKTDLTNGVYEIVQLDPAQAAADSVANSNSLRSVASAIVGVRADDVRAVDSMTARQNERTNRFITKSGLQLDAVTFEAEGGIWATFKASAPEGSADAATAAAINGRTANWAFRLDQSHASRLTQPIVNLVQKPAPPAQQGAAPVPPNAGGAPVFSPQAPGAPGMGITGDQVIPGF